MTNGKLGMMLGTLALALAVAGCGGGKTIQQGEETFSIDVGLYDEALSLQVAGEYYDAIRVWKELLADQPRFAQGHYNLGVIYDYLNLVPEAIDSYERASLLVAELGDAHKADQALYNAKLGAAYLRYGMEIQAADALHAAIERDGYNPRAHFNMAGALIAQGNYDEGLIHADIAVDLFAVPDTRNASGLARTVDRNLLGKFLLRQAECHLVREEWEKARTVLERARKQCAIEVPATMWDRLNAGEAVAAGKPVPEPGFVPDTAPVPEPTPEPQPEPMPEEPGNGMGDGE